MGVGVIPAVAAAVSTAVSFISNTGQSIVQSVGSINLGNISGIFNSISSVVNDISGVVTQVSGLINQVVSPLTKTIDSVTNLANQINDQIVKPIVGPIESTLNTYKTLQTEIDNSLKQGLQGLIQVPGEIANALTGVDAAYQHSTQELAAARSKDTKDVLVPGIKEAVAVPSEAWTKAFVDTMKGEAPPDDFPARVSLDNLPNIDAWFAKGRGMLEKISGDKTSWGWVGRVLVQLLELAPYVAGNTVSLVEEAEYGARRALPVHRLPPNEALAAWSRNILSEPDLAGELADQGLDDSRQKVMRELLQWIAPAAQAVTWRARAIIDDKTFGEIMSIWQFSLDNAENFYQASFNVPNPTQRLRLEPRYEAAAARFLDKTLNSKEPSGLLSFYERAQVENGQASLDWLEHWHVPPPAWWVQAYFRKLRTRTEVYDAFKLLAVPEELWDDIMVTEQQVLSAFILMDVIKAGVFTEAEATDWALQAGLPPEQAAALVKMALASGKTTKATTAADLAKLSVSTVKDLFDQNAIDAATYEELLIAHGYGSEAAALTVELEQLKLATTQRKDTATYIIDLANLGQLTLDAAVAEFNRLGYSQQEIAAYQLKIHKSKAKAAKHPTQSELDKMLENNIITVDTWTAEYALLGFDATWAGRFLELLHAEGKI